MISIHALLAESDNINSSVTTADKISIHALLAESDKMLFEGRKRQEAFLSTLSLRRATAQSMYHNTIFSFLSTLSLRRATRLPINNSVALQFLSTLSLRRATIYGCWMAPNHLYFYPRSPCGERLKNSLCQVVNRRISIHALLAESDSMHTSLFCGCSGFLSTLSLRRATEKVPADVYYQAFLSTLSLRRATVRHMQN